MSDNVLFAALSARWTTRPEASAVITADTRLSYSQLDADIWRMQAALTRAGAGPGSRVVVTAGKSLSFVILYLACVRGGVVFVPLNPSGTAAEIRARVDDVDPVLVVDDETVVALARSSRSERARPLVAPRAADDLAAILFTSGTTGRPKGAMLTHENLRSNAAVLVSEWRMAPDDEVLHVLPAFHAHGLFVALHVPLIAAAAIRLEHRFDARRSVELLEDATVFMGVPTHYRRLLDEPSLDRRACETVRLFVSGSAPLPSSTWHEFRDRTGHEILERYGMTETGMLASNPYDGPRVPGTVGFALAGVETRLRSDAGEVVIGEVGELEVRGANVSPGYWRDQASSDAARRAGWFCTGDLARADQDGRLQLVGRTRDLIITGGFNVYPAEIEQALDQLEPVAESAVIGVPNADLGEAVTAILVPTGAPVGDESLSSALRESLAPYKCPKSFHWVRSLPRNAMGKIDKQALRSRFAGDAEAT